MSEMKSKRSVNWHDRYPSMAKTGRREVIVDTHSGSFGALSMFSCLAGQGQEPSRLG